MTFVSIFFAYSEKKIQTKRQCQSYAITISITILLCELKIINSKSVVVIPKAMREKTLIACHDDVGHMDAKKNSSQFAITLLVAKYAQGL